MGATPGGHGLTGPTDPGGNVTHDAGGAGVVWAAAGRAATPEAKPTRTVTVRATAAAARAPPAGR